MNRFPMRHLIFALLCAGVLPVPSAAQELGIDTTRFDRSVRPQDDFYGFVNGGWLRRTTIPADRNRIRTHPDGTGMYLPSEQRVKIW